ncbi:MAG: SRPBCC domain-containing protein, partial [Myxococcota bacterium]|nr:SRPBCC domain-containing protein [Myxococcota bacterium]
TTAEGLASWLVDEARVDPRPGGRIVFEWIDDDGNKVEERGLVHKWRPTSHFEIAWDSTGTFPSVGSRISFQLARDGDETRLSLVHSGGEALEEEETRARMDDDWRSALNALQSMLDAP